MAAEGLEQIDMNRYRVRLEQAGITQALHVAMAFCGREVAMQEERHDYRPKHAPTLFAPIPTYYKRPADEEDPVGPAAKRHEGEGLRSPKPTQ